MTRINFLVTFRNDYHDFTESLKPKTYKIPLIKRIFDITVASVALLLASPILILVAILIKLESRGPIYHVSKRVGSGYSLMLYKQGIYTLLLYGQAGFYAAAMVGWFLERRSLRNKLVFVPFYFSIMNIAAFRGFFRYVKGKQSVLWERANRANT